MFFEYFGFTRSVINYLRKMNVILESRNSDEFTKAYETISKAPKEEQSFYDVFIGEASRANA